MQSSGLARPALGPVRLDFRHLDGIRQGVVKVLERGVRAGPVRVENMAGRVELDGLRKLLAAIDVSQLFQELELPRETRLEGGLEG